jgi:phage terminase large subunit-like protein
MQKWDDCTDPRHSPPLPSKAISLFVGCDASTKRDRSAVVSVYRDEIGKLKLGPKRFWQPSKSQWMDLENTMEAFLLELHRGYNLASVAYDPYQFHRSSMTLQKKGLPMVEFPQTTGNLTEMGQNLYDLVEYQNLVLYPCKDLRLEASVAIAKESSRGLRICKEKSSQKIDQIVSLAMSCLGAVKAKSTPFRYQFVDLNSPLASAPDIDPASGLVDEHRRPMLRDTEPKQLVECRLNDCNEPILMGCEYCQRHSAMRYK